MSEAAVPVHDWLTDREEELRRDHEVQQEIRRIRTGIANGTFVGTTHSRSDMERLANEP